MVQFDNSPPLAARSPITGAFVSVVTVQDWFNGAPRAHTCRFDIAHYKDELYDEYRIVFPPHLSRAVAKRRAEFLAGRICATAALQAGGTIKNQVGIGPRREPLWPTGYLGSISHSYGHAVAMAAPHHDYLGIGIDVEGIIAPQTARTVASQILDEQESQFVARAYNRVAHLFTLIFSIKESFFKAAYPTVQACFDFSALSVVAVDAERRTIDCRLNETLHNSRLMKGQVFTGQFYYPMPSEVATYMALPTA